MRLKGKVIVRYQDGELAERYGDTELHTITENNFYLGFRVFNQTSKAWDYYSNQFQYEVSNVVER